MQKSEQVVQKANADLNSAITALETSYSSLEGLDSPKSGIMSKMLAARALVDSQRVIIQHNSEWVGFAKNQVSQAKEQLKLDTIEYEKFNYLELQEIEKEIKKIKIQEAKDLDEIALMTYGQKNK
ncbi:flagellar FliJ family protein [Candidatus Sulfurimonas marisnigri]|uniref:Flagellar FliJ family protein n=2 Tax=Candidatus Sulfurimonas marisnigri TaxID=2740405 RepID=A0A7S7RRM4_9BACT|nr:flagellar FliJ family protein [Candidatus Sulfurimonas marisnigri]